MNRPRLVMASGTAPGAGKSSLVQRLAAALEPAGGAAIVSEDDVWGARRLDAGPIDHSTARAEFVELLHAGLPRHPAALLTTFDRVAATIQEEWWLQDWTWLTLCELFVAGHDRRELDRAIADRLAAHLAIVLYLQVDPRTSLERAVEARGATWLGRHADGLGLVAADIDDVADVYRRREDAHLRLLSAMGIAVTVLDGDRAEGEVTDDALVALGVRTQNDSGKS